MAPNPPAARGAPAGPWHPSISLAMLRLIAGRLATGIPTLLAVSICVFAIVRLIPGDPARLLAGDFATDQIVDDLRARWRLNDPLPVQYAAYLGGVLHGDLGRSIATSTPVLPELTERFLRTLQLAVAAIGIGAGLVSAVRRATIIDHLATALALTGVSTPIFWSGLILILLFSVTLEWLPAGGTGSPRHLVLPAVSLGLFGAGVLARQTRSGMLEVLGQDFVRTARAKGLPERLVVIKHALKNALIPVVTVLGDQFGRLLGGAILTETVFSWPGMGRYLIDAISQRDYPAVQGAILVFAAAVVLINLLVDVSYGVLDPRVRPE